MDTRMLTELIDRYKSDPESVYNTWFVSSEERMKAFRSIRRGVKEGKGDANLFCRRQRAFSGSAARAKGEFQPRLLCHPRNSKRS